MRYLISFNGEIYNSEDLRGDLRSRGAQFIGTSDTEVMLAAFDAFGVRESVPLFEGMFAFAVWDSKDEALYLCRDRVGEKPLYWLQWPSCCAFGSELKVLQALPDIQTEINESAVADFLHYRYVPEGETIFRHIRKLRPGNLVRIQASGTSEYQYWDPISEYNSRSVGRMSCRPEEEVVSWVDESLQRAVRRQMIADVPVGAFLSGGVDSSLVVALMRRVTSVPVKTFTISFGVPEFDEVAFAAAVATHLEVEHVALTLSERDVCDTAEQISDIYDEPFADSSQIPTAIVSRLARSQVKVCLTGDGADELFGGYARYVAAPRLTRLTGLTPRGLLRAGHLVALSLPRAWSTWSARGLGALLGPGYRLFNPIEKFRKAMWVLQHEGLEERYRALMGAAYGGKVCVSASRALEMPGGLDEVEGYMLRDLVQYLPGDILAKVDRAAMHASLETRAPFLDCKMLNCAFEVSSAVKFKDGRGKWPLRALLRRYLPDGLIDRPKNGFRVPLSNWLTGPLRSWALDQLHSQTLASLVGVETTAVMAEWRRMEGGDRSGVELLWNLAVLGAWMQTRNGTMVERVSVLRGSS